MGAPVSRAQEPGRARGLGGPRLRTDPFGGTDFRDRPHAGAFVWRRFFRDIGFPPAPPVAFEAAHGWTSPTHGTAHLIHVMRQRRHLISAVGNPAERDEDRLVRSTAGRNAGCHVQGRHCRLPPLRHGSRSPDRAGLLSDARSDRDARHRRQRLSSRPPSAPCSVASSVRRVPARQTTVPAEALPEPHALPVAEIAFFAPRAVAEEGCALRRWRIDQTPHIPSHSFGHRSS